MTPQDQLRFPPLPVRLRHGLQTIIRPLTLDDGWALGEFYESVPPQDVRFYCPHELSRAKAMENAAKALSPLQVVLVLETGPDKLAGYGWIRWNQPDAPQSTLGICVGPDCQNQGAGRALMSRLLEIAARIGPPLIGLTVQKANARALALYQNMGFTVVREQVRAARPNMSLEAEPEYHMQRPAR